MRNPPESVRGHGTHVSEHALPDDVIMSFWSVAVIVTICVLVCVFLFLFLTDFCCELSLPPDDASPSSASCPLDPHQTSLRRPGLQPSAPPAEDEDRLLPKDTVAVVTLGQEGEELAGRWASYLHFCRRLSGAAEGGAANDTKRYTENAYTL